MRNSSNTAARCIEYLLQGKWSPGFVVAVANLAWTVLMLVNRPARHTKWVRTER